MNAVSLGSANLTVSVAMPTYNHEAFIAQAIESALMQKTDFNYEIVIGDDGSTDRTREIVTDYARRHPQRIRPLLHEHNLGGLGANNAAAILKACAGQYIAILEGDDYWTDPTKLQKQVELLGSNIDLAMCFTNADIVAEKTGQIRPGAFAPPYRAATFTLDDLLEYSNLVPTLTIMFRCRYVRALPDWYFRLNCGDVGLKSLCAQHGGIGYIDESTAVYRQHSKGLHSGNAARHNLESLVEDYFLIRDNLHLKGTRGFRKGIGKAAFQLACIYRADRELSKMLGYSLRSILWSPLGDKMKYAGAFSRWFLADVRRSLNVFS